MTTRNRRRETIAAGLRNLLLSLGAIALIWGVVLPNLSKSSRNAAYLDWLEEHRIDPSAMFYTELDCVDQLLQPDRHLGTDEQ